MSTPHRLLIVGDFNFHVDTETDRSATQFLDLITSLNLKQHVSFPTHQGGHTLDLILSRDTESFVSDVGSTSYLPSDHVAVKCSLHIRKPGPVKITINMRKIRDINIDHFRDDILQSELCVSPSNDTKTLIDQYGRVLSALLDKHAPMISRIVRCHPKSPWFNDELRTAKQQLRALERKAFSPRGLEIDRQIFRSASHQYNNKLSSAKKWHHRDQLKDCSNRELFRKVDQLTRPRSAKVLPSNHGSAVPLPERFIQFFAEKVNKITAELQSSSPTDTDRLPEHQTTFSFDKFKRVTEKEVLKVITNSTSTTCNLDPIPTHLLKKCLHELTPIITFVINESFNSGCFPEKFKLANIVPILKGLKCDSDVLNNYRPIANLRFFAKTLERMAALQLQRYLNDHELHAKFQSGYRSFHSVETALLRITNDVLLTLDKGEEVILVLLDFSSAFDTIKHDVLLQRLSQRFGIRSKALDWIESYLSNRNHTVVIGNEKIVKLLYCSRGTSRFCARSPVVYTVHCSTRVTN